MRFRNLSFGVSLPILLLSLAPLAAQTPTPPAAEGAAAQPQRQRPPRIVRLGVATPGVSLSMDDLKKTATFPVEGSPDWSVITPEATWVSSARANHVVQLLPKTNTVGVIVDVQRPCAGLIAAFGSIWAPSCAKDKPEIERIDPATGKITAAVPAEAANSEGGITASPDSIWFVTKPSSLVRIDPRTNAITATIDLPAGSENPTFGGGFIWVSGYGSDSLYKVDPKTNKLVATIAIGPKPRFITVGDGSVWTLNQGDGSVSRVDMKTSKLVATIQCGIQGSGGDLSFGDGYVFAAQMDFPLTQIDPKTNKVVAQWAGPGGDGMRAGLGSVWLSNLRLQTVYRIPITKP
jgi:YVTN family beta-propeller protein